MAGGHRDGESFENGEATGVGAQQQQQPPQVNHKRCRTPQPNSRTAASFLSPR